MYTTTQDTAQRPIRLFRLPNTLAGDAAVTIFVQCIITWFIEALLVGHDLAQGSVAPIGFVGEPRRRPLRWLLLLPCSAAADDDDAPVPPPPRLASPAAIAQHLLRALVFAVLGFLLLWPASVGILTAVGRPDAGDYVFADRWAPPVFKLVLGGVLGLLVTPAMAGLWLVRAGWEAGAPAAARPAGQGSLPA